MIKIVINRCFGGYSLSKAKAAYEELGLEWDGYGYAYDDNRTDPKLVVCVEKLGPSASGRYANLEVIEIPDDVEYEITNYDGMECVEETHRKWY